MENSTLKKISSDLKFVYSDNNSISVVFQNNDLLMGVVGEFNSNLKELEKLTNTNIYFRGNSILIKNNTGKNELVKNAIQFLTEQFINYPGQQVISNSATDSNLLLDNFRLDDAVNPIKAGRIYISDPLGNLMISYPADINPKGILKDLKKLLRASRIG